MQRIQRRSRALAASVLGLSLFTAQAQAADGVKLLHQRSVLPIVIDKSGSYALRSNIATTSVDTTVIKINVDNVSLDLNGFVIQGPVVCSPNLPTTCSAAGNGIGIDGQGHSGIVITNGTVAGMGDDGISIAGGRVERMRVTSNGGRGIVVTGGIGTGRVNEVEASVNGSDGIHVSGGIVTNCIANNNGYTGIHMAAIGRVSDNHAEANGEHGIVLEMGGVVSGNVVDLNTLQGIRVEAGSSLVGNHAQENGDRGFSAAPGSTLIGNSALGNADLGFDLSDSGYAHNAATGNNGGGAQFTGGTQLGSNLCVNMSCP